MEILPIHTGVLERGADLAAALRSAVTLRTGDIVVISSKVVAVTEGATVRLKDLEISPEARSLAQKSGLEPDFAELVLRETKRMNGIVSGTCPHAILTALRPDGMKHGQIYCPNAGVDQSNATEGCAIPWPTDSAASARKLAKALGVPVIISDSCCHPGRLGVTAFALAVSGIEPMKSEIGTPDLYGKKLRITHEAVADQLATAANAVMGNSAQATPAAVIRGHDIAPSDVSGWVEGIEPEDDLFSGMFTAPSGTLKT